MSDSAGVRNGQEPKCMCETAQNERSTGTKNPKTGVRGGGEGEE